MAFMVCIPCFVYYVKNLYKTKRKKKINKIKSKLTCNVQLQLQIVQGICMHFQGCNMLSARQLCLQTPLQ